MCGPKNVQICGNNRRAIVGITSRKRTGGGIAARLCSMVNWNCVNPARFLLGAIFSLWELAAIMSTVVVDASTAPMMVESSDCKTGSGAVLSASFGTANCPMISDQMPTCSASLWSKILDTSALALSTMSQ